MAPSLLIFRIRRLYKKVSSIPSFISCFENIDLIVVVVVVVIIAIPHIKRVEWRGESS